MHDIRYSCQISMKRNFFEKYSNINFMKIRSERAELFLAHGRTDGRSERPTKIHDESNSRFSQFFQRAYKGRNREINIYILN